MKAMILNGCSKDDQIAQVCDQHLLKVLTHEDISVNHIMLANTALKGCIGCLSCFFKTPGECRFNDLGRNLPIDFLESDFAIFISAVKFGTFSSLFAKAYNRMVIQLESHLGETINGELRRKKRYETQYPALIVIGIMAASSPEEKKIFTSLINRNAFLHLHSPKHHLVFCSPDQSQNDIEQQMQNTCQFIRN